jgi:hypothetical protein
MGLDPNLDAVEHQLTQRDLDYTPDDGNLYEVIDGALVVTPSSTARRSSSSRSPRASRSSIGT